MLCEKEASHRDSVTVTRGLDTIINSSISRKDGIAEKLQGLSSICVHRTCRKNYTRMSSIESVLRPSPKKCKTLRSSLSSFDFKMHCLFYGDVCDLSAEKKKPLNKKGCVRDKNTVQD